MSDNIVWVVEERIGGQDQWLLSSIHETQASADATAESMRAKHGDGTEESDEWRVTRWRVRP